MNSSQYSISLSGHFSECYVWVCGCAELLVKTVCVYLYVGYVILVMHIHT